ncbi:MAG: hypothetical protein J0I20_00745 [Chloroflexi bacterium]|nr:hypothetical protein [Chloroflexota bacterium]OJW06441.1 MAG: hypothetical protein BGO39_00010 [Chloroflexi bacterium 54-19]
MDQKEIKEKKSVYLPSTISPETSEALNKKAAETGNRSFIVEKALRAFLGLNELPEIEKQAS